MNKKELMIKYAVVILFFTIGICLLIKINYLIYLNNKLANSQLINKNKTDFYWNTYLNTKYNFGFEYPSDLMNLEEGISVDSLNLGEEFYVAISNDLYPELYITVYKNKNNQNLKSFATEQLNKTEVTPINKIENFKFVDRKILGHTAIDVTYRSQSLEGEVTNTYILKNDLIYVIKALNDHIKIDPSSGISFPERDSSTGELIMGVPKINRADFQKAVVDSFKFFEN